MSKLSPDKDEFVAFKPSDTRFDVPTLLAGASASSFRFDHSLLESLKNDPDFARTFDAAVGDRVSKELETLHAERIKKRFEEGYQAGYEKGLVDAVTDLEQKRACLEKLQKQFGMEKKHLLYSHQGRWLTALRHVLAAFGVPNTESRILAMKQWMDVKLETFDERENLIVSLSSQDHEQLKQHLPKKFAIRIDPNLSEGQIVLESPDGGIFFSIDEQWSELDQILEAAIGDAKKER